MIQIYYRPLMGLKPLHLAVMGVMESSGDLDVMASRLALPLMMVEHAIDDLVSWKLADRKDSRVVLSVIGERSVNVWRVTDNNGYWQVKDDRNWLLGKGKFSFRSPLARLIDAGLDPETGEILSASEAEETLRSFYQKRATVDEQISGQHIAKRLARAIQKRQGLASVIGVELGNCVTVLQLNQVHKLINRGLGPSMASSRVSAPGSEDQEIQTIRQTLADTKDACLRSVKESDAALQAATRVWLAEWLGRRIGYLKTIIQADACSVLVVSECEAA